MAARLFWHLNVEAKRLPLLEARHRLVFRRCVARNTYEEQHHRSIQNPEGFWSDAAADISWSRKWHTVLDRSKAPFYRWFAGGQLNMCYNAVDRHVDAGFGASNALIYDSPVTGVQKKFTFEQLRDEVVIYMPMIPEASLSAHVQPQVPRNQKTKKWISREITNFAGEREGERERHTDGEHPQLLKCFSWKLFLLAQAVFAMLACARLGAVHSVVFGGFAGLLGSMWPELATRIKDAAPKAVIWASCGVEPKGQQ
eukprot:Skav231885  [mRNA]  locus=scaffold54:335104:337277:- [translate_table: standard]